MSDRICALTVALETDIHEDDIVQLINAIEHIKGVLKVVPEVKDSIAFVFESRVRDELTRKLYEALK